MEQRSTEQSIVCDDLQVRFHINWDNISTLIAYPYIESGNM